MEDLAAPGNGVPPANGNGNGGGKGKQAAPKGREAFRGQRRESETPAGGKQRLRRFGLGPGALGALCQPRAMCACGVLAAGHWALQPRPSSACLLPRVGVFLALWPPLAAQRCGLH
ncbi:hypothetical protein P7K49_025629 [Saguinus oedipus]|uniref:Uncharacterized protein n=1 Tax=Saguinus oedipus TaxID=9490 RepID=A0ABQ9UIH6_SAGOE|nr:hypothetical protein P7K49_025629 [Saguinus oedipus]